VQTILNLCSRQQIVKINHRKITGIISDLLGSNGVLLVMPANLPDKTDDVKPGNKKYSGKLDDRQEKKNGHNKPTVNYATEIMKAEDERGKKVRKSEDVKLSHFLLPCNFKDDN
jgi:hypothetical protein